jgi:hypothetical protein
VADVARLYKEAEEVYNRATGGIPQLRQPQVVLTLIKNVAETAAVRPVNPIQPL